MKNQQYPLLRLLPLLLCVCLLLTGCHGQVVPGGSRPAATPTPVPAASAAEEEAAPLVFDESRTYEITFWAKTESNVTQANIYKQAIEDFQALYPNIRVKLKLYTNYGDIYKDVINNIATDSTPNVCITYPDHIATYLTGQNIVSPLDALMADPDYGLGGSALRFASPTLAEMIPQFLAEGMLNGQTYALPYMRSTEVCYVNKTYVERLGYTLPEILTWDFIWEVSEAALAKDENGNYLVNGQQMLIPFIYKSTDNMMIQYLRQKGAGYSSERGEVLLFNDETRAFLREIASHVQSGAFSTFKISSYPANWLNAGQCIFAIDSTAGSTWMGSDAPLIDIDEDQMVDFETVVMMAPQVDPENPQMISQGPSVCVFNRDDPQVVLASWLFAQYLLTDEVQMAYASTEGYVPVTTRAQENPAYQAYLALAGTDNDLHYQVKMDATTLLLAHMEDTFTTPVFNGSADLRDAAGHLIEETAKGVRRKKTIDDAFFNDLFKKTVSLYHLDQIQVAPAPVVQVEAPADPEAVPEEAPADPEAAPKPTPQTAVSGGSLSQPFLLSLTQEDGPLPATAVWLLCGLGAVWLGILAYLLAEGMRQKRAKNRANH